uniref:Uncharacterized protein n=1 Tax=Arundo donax TaxID=35708 RepID=A0A0A9FE36_ARUDO
MPLASPEP